MSPLHQGLLVLFDGREIKTDKLIRYEILGEENGGYFVIFLESSLLRLDL